MVLPSLTLEHQLEGKLDHARVVYRLIDHGKSSRLAYILHPAPAAAQEELRMIEDIEELRSEVQVHPFAEREMLDKGQVGIYESRSGDRRAGRISQFARRRRHERAGIEPGGKRVHLCRTYAAGVGGHVTRLIGIAHHIRPVEAISVPLEEGAGLVVAGDHEHGKPGRGFFNCVYFPVSQNGVGRSVPVAPKALALAEGQIVENAGRELVVEVELRKTPVQL